MKRVKMEDNDGSFECSTLLNSNVYDDDDEEDSDDSLEQGRSDEVTFPTSSSIYYNFGTSQKSQILSRAKDELICVVCGASANGYNFDAITCESCKAFFRRNAFKPLSQFRCSNPNSTGAPCLIDIVTRKKCKKCRVIKCFNMGMRKDWIMTDHEREEKKRKIEENRRRKDCGAYCYGGDEESNSSSPSSGTTRPIRRRRRKGKSFIGSSSARPVQSKIVQSKITPIEDQIVAIREAYNHSVRLVQGHGLPVYYDNMIKILNVYEINVRRLIYFVKLVPDLVYLDKTMLEKLIKANMVNLLLVDSMILRVPDTTQMDDECVKFLFGGAALALISKLKEKLSPDAIQVLLLVVLFNQYNVSLNYVEKEIVEKMRCKYMNLLVDYSREWSTSDLLEVYQVSYAASESIRRAVSISSSVLRPLMAQSLGF